MARPSDRDREIMETSRNNWLRHRDILEPFRVRPGDRRTTPPPVIDIGELFPELADTATTTVRLNPRYGDEPAVDTSKLGGTILWPVDEPWPVCPAHDIPLVSVLQMRAEDFPEMPFPPGKDLFQVLWCPRDHEGERSQPCPMLWAAPSFFWRNWRDISRPMLHNPAPVEAFYDYVPFTCRLMPERVIEYPSVYELPEDMVQRIHDWENQNLGPDGMHACEYEAELSVCEGTKVGGYLHWIQFPWIPMCPCGEVMEHLLTIDSMEWNGLIDPRWTPLEERRILSALPEYWDDWTERDMALQRALWNPTGIMLGDAGNMKLFVCRRCPGWPIVPSIECA